jgi:tRNA/rRNA methyltransferase
MHNFGLTQLVLVNPIAVPNNEEARRLATHGEFVLLSARTVRNIEEAVTDCLLVVATSARNAGVFRGTSSMPLRQVAPIMRSTMNSGPIAIVFGPEPSGLTNQEIDRCHYLLHIPANSEYEALNLAQAVGVCLYELHSYLLPEKNASEAGEAPAEFAAQDRMFEHLRCGLEAIHFLYGEKADALMHAMRHLIGRANPTPTEVKMLHGLARQLEWVAARLPQAESSPVSEFDKTE